MYGTIGPRGQAFDQRLASLRRAHCENNNLAAVEIAQSNRFRNSTPVEWVHRVGHAFSDDGVGVRVELDLCDFGYLFYADNDSHLNQFWPGVWSIQATIGNQLQVGKRDLSPLSFQDETTMGGDKSLFPTCDSSNVILLRRFNIITNLSSFSLSSSVAAAEQLQALAIQRSASLLRSRNSIPAPPPRWERYRSYARTPSSRPLAQPRRTQ